MNDLYTSYLKAFKRGLPVILAGVGTFYVPSYSNPKEKHLVTYDGEGMPLCTCKAGGRCWHGAAVVAVVRPDLQRAWDERRIFESKSLQLAIRQGKLNPRKFPRIRKEMERINEKYPVVKCDPTCTSCGGELTKEEPRDLESEDLCDSCYLRIEKIWSNIEMVRLA